MRTGMAGLPRADIADGNTGCRPPPANRLPCQGLDWARGNVGMALKSKGCQCPCFRELCSFSDTLMWRITSASGTCHNTPERGENGASDAPAFVSARWHLAQILWKLGSPQAGQSCWGRTACGCQSVGAHCACAPRRASKLSAARGGRTSHIPSPECWWPLAPAVTGAVGSTATWPVRRRSAASNAPVFRLNRLVHRAMNSKIELIRPGRRRGREGPSATPSHASAYSVRGNSAVAVDANSTGLVLTRSGVDIRDGIL